MASRPVRFSVAATCTTSNGVTLEHGTYSGSEEEILDHAAPSGRRRPRFVINEDGPEATFLDVTELVEKGDIIVVLP